MSACRFAFHGGRDANADKHSAVTKATHSVPSRSREFHQERAWHRIARIASTPRAPAH